MAEKNWAVSIDGDKKTIDKLKTYEEGIDTALKLISERFTGIETIIDDALKHPHTAICKKFIKKFRDFSNLRSADILEILDEYGEKNGTYKNTINENGFYAEYADGDYFIAEFEDSLTVETNIWSENEDTKHYYISVRTPTDEVKFCVNKTLSETANIFLVYKELLETPQTRAEISAKIAYKYSSEYDIHLPDDTISNQIHALQDLGIPIPKRSFYIDYSKPITPDYSKCTPRTYIMLVYLTLEDIDEAHALSTQQDIIDAVYNKFGVKLQRQKVKNYIDILIDLNSGVKHNGNGYWMKE